MRMPHETIDLKEMNDIFSLIAWGCQYIYIKKRKREKPFENGDEEQHERSLALTRVFP